MNYEPTPLQAVIAVLGVVGGIVGAFVRRWWKMQDDAKASYIDGRTVESHSCEERIDAMRTEYDRRLAVVETRVTVLQMGLAELVPLVAQEHQVTAMAILARLAGQIPPPTP